MYEVGDLIIYGSTGVCRVEQITPLNTSGNLKFTDEEKLYYTLKPLYQSEVIYTPVDNTKVFTRPVISKEKAQQLIAMIPSLEPEAFHSASISQLKEHYRTATQTHDCGDLIEMLMSLYVKKHNMVQLKKKFGQVDEQFMKLAEEKLYGEFAVALDIPKEEVEGYIWGKADACVM